jgi:hypothetical protein
MIEEIVSAPTPDEKPAPGKGEIKVTPFYKRLEEL